MLQVVAPYVAEMLHLKTLTINVVTGVAGFQSISHLSHPLPGRGWMMGEMAANLFLPPPDQQWVCPAEARRPSGSARPSTDRPGHRRRLRAIPKNRFITNSFNLQIFQRFANNNTNGRADDQPMAGVLATGVRGDAVVDHGNGWFPLGRRIRCSGCFPFPLECLNGRGFDLCRGSVWGEQ